MDATPTNRFCGALPEDVSGQPYTFGDYLTDAREALRAAESLEMDVRLGLRVCVERRIEDQLAEAERLIEAARRML